MKYANNEGSREQMKQGGATRTLRPKGKADWRPVMAEENAVPKANPDKSRGELNEGRPHPTRDVPAGDYPTENPGLQDEHESNDLGQKLAHMPKAEKSQLEGPAASAPLPDELSSAADSREMREKEGQGIVRDERGQVQPADKNKAQQTSSRKQHGQSDQPLENAEKKKSGEFSGEKSS